jgi:hypothetical protein
MAKNEDEFISQLKDPNTASSTTFATTSGEDGKS